jgi:glyoxylase-like metal-dependent hydrolase (beta-lactamase superfamily II)
VSNRPLKIEVVVSQPFAENTYIAHLPNSTDCIVVDPGFEPEPILQLLSQRNLTPLAILNTHGHIDHIAGNGAIKEQFPTIPLIIGAGDAGKLTDPQGNLSGVYGFPITSPPADELVREGDRISYAGIDLAVLETPGHSLGHVVFVFTPTGEAGGAVHSPSIVFGGDVLFRGGVGRTDFPDGDPDQLVASIHTKLFPLPDDTIVLPGHGPATNIGDERRHNPFVGEAAGYTQLR